MLKLIQPEYVIPAHAGHEKARSIALLCGDIGIGNPILTNNGDKIQLT